MTARCDELDAFFDGQLAVDAAQRFRDHLATCSRCQTTLRGRMLEEALTSDAPPVATVAPPRLRWVAPAAAVIALAAAAALVWWTQRSPAPTDELELAIAVEHGTTQMRGTSAHVGDTLHASATGGAGHRAVWIYRDDTTLVLACPGGATCRDTAAATIADLEVRAVGTYSFVVVSAASAPAIPTGSLDRDVAAAASAGARYRIESVDVR